MKTYEYYGSGIFKNRKFTITAINKKVAIEKARKTIGGCTVRTMKVKKGAN